MAIVVVAVRVQAVVIEGIDAWTSVATTLWDHEIKYLSTCYYPTNYPVEYYSSDFPAEFE